MAWRCRFLAARRDQRGRVIAIPDTLVDFHTDRHTSQPYYLHLVFPIAAPGRKLPQPKELLFRSWLRSSTGAYFPPLHALRTVRPVSCGSTIGLGFAPVAISTPAIKRRPSPHARDYAAALRRRSRRGCQGTRGEDQGEGAVLRRVDERRGVRARRLERDRQGVEQPRAAHVLEGLRRALSARRWGCHLRYRMVQSMYRYAGTFVSISFCRLLSAARCSPGSHSRL